MKYLTALIILLALITTAHAQTAPRPNILYFYVDDMGWGSIGPNGQAERRAKGLPSVQTPNIDKLAAQGVNFSRGYGCHVCSPARSSQQTGFHQGHTFADRNDPDNAKKAIRTEDITMGDALAKAGYVTGYWGKWGYGGSKDKANPVVQNTQTLPTLHGYKHVLAELHHVRAHTFFQPTLWHAPAKPGAKGGIDLIPNSMASYQNNKAYPNQPANQNHPNYPKVAYCDDTYAFAALDFVRNQAKHYQKTGHPFFGLFAAQIPHAPFDEIAKLPGWNAAYKSDPHFADQPKQAQQWAAMVTRIDAHFGNILAALEDPNNDGDTSDSVAANTLVIFQSDNGGPGGPNNASYLSNGGLSGNKGKIQEGGIRVPLVMRWPSHITVDSKLKAGSTYDATVDVTDLLPTFCELAGTEVPLGLDGVSIAPTLVGKGVQRKREFLIHEAGNGQSIIRGNQKLVRGGAKVKGAKKKKSADPALSLFDLEKDRAEKKNLAAKQGKLVKELEALLIGERVNEPHGFSNTYHQWTGKAGAKTSDKNNWSDYVYENEGIRYQDEKGAPARSWTARISNETPVPNRAVVDGHLDVLALEISGRKGTQSVELGSDAQLTGRNEIRVGANGVLDLQGGTAHSLRWVDVLKGGLLRGKGKIVGNLYTQGTLELSGTLSISGTAYLGGSFKPGSRKGVIRATSIQGEFSEVPEGVQVSYGAAEVTWQGL